MVTTTVMCSLLPLILVTLFVICVFYLYRQRSQHFHHHQQQQQHVDEPATSLLRHTHHDIRLIEVKARGRFGSVWKAELPSGDVIAVKVLPENERQSWLTEQQFYAQPCTANCANILQFIGAELRVGGDLWLLTEYHDNGSLMDHLKSHTVSLSELASIALSLVNGLLFLHSDVNGKRAVAHRDIKSRNVLVRHVMTACIADFGLALILDAQPQDTLSQV